MFISTDKTKYQENRKAQIKNFNLPFLQYMYMGDKTTPLACLLTGRPAFVMVKDFVTGKDKMRFSVDFNHIRQKSTVSRHSGNSIDKSNYAPSEIFRMTFLHESRNMYFSTPLVEFMTIMPVCTEYHSYISQDSAKGDITLRSFSGRTWPWVLKSKKNFNKFLKDMNVNINGLTYDLFIDHLSDINHPPIQQRVCVDYKTRQTFFQ